MDEVFGSLNLNPDEVIYTYKGETSNCFRS